LLQALLLVIHARQQVIFREKFFRSSLLLPPGCIHRTRIIADYKTSERYTGSRIRNHLYWALYLVNCGLDITLTGLKRLEELGLDRIDLSEHEVNVELARSAFNDELTGYLQGYEQEDEHYWGDRKSAVERQRADPDDVFFKANDRKQEIKEKIKQLQAGLARQHPKRTQAKKPRRTRKKQAA